MKFASVRVASIVIAILACAGLQAALGGTNDYVQRLAVLAGLYVTLAVSLNLINGITGQFSIGHAAFYMVGAYSAGFVTQKFHTQPVGSLPWLLQMIAFGAVMAAIAGFVVGLPSLRLKGDYLAVVTLGFGEILRILVQNVNELGGSYGLRVPKTDFELVAITWLLAILCIAVCRNLLKTAHGLPFLAVREDEIASSSMGVNVTFIKVAAFVLGSAFAGAAGAILAHYEGFITPATFSMDVSFIILTMVVLGGTGSITGSAIAAILLSLLPEILRGLKGADGQALAFTGNQIVGTLVAIALVVAFVKTTMERQEIARRQRTLRMLLGVAALVILVPVLSAIFGMVPVMKAKTVAAEQLRLVIFSVVLIVIMLLRPQGIFAHHEFSWSWVKKLFGDKNQPHTEVAA